ncbi:UDP:flavonoid glycosyltransferase YjiC (YdhE family) [Kibdelosporangium banguiense]|uniref:UDP:flavonoid glycosyltransferase YjiC (YdhE family) n=1 Tax=Kibdelosporangium banguiense TaxID=1365924 RepID=A0ABS4TWB5_9PSEU|nr:nucleotide disphospho-sugar-binding domain-containing protein [Kibdelosporangium banguiense]MBP2328663.1 UDP:flavonoid glycosyltransferase YjiC (YdhE family) [Kibdelosporangium banguiense]
MRVLFVPLPWPTHIFPVVGLAWACRLAGGDVRVAVDDSMTDVVVTAGLTPVPLGDGFDFMADLRTTRELPPWDGPGATLTGSQRSRPLDRYLSVAEAQIDALSAFAGHWRPDVVVFDPMNFAGPLVAQQLGVPAVRHLWGPDITRLLGWPGMGNAQIEWPERLADLFARHGGKPVDDLAALTVDPCPAVLQVDGHPHRVTIRPVPYNGPGWLPDDLAAAPARRRVLVTWGTAATQVGGAKEFGVPRILQALADEDVDVVVAATRRDAEQLDSVPANARVLTGVPLHTVLPTCAAIVHQGGGGTLLTSAFYGVPQLAVVTEPNQRITSAGLPDTGAGVLMPVQDAEPEHVRAAVWRLLDEPAYQAAAAGLRTQLLAQTPPAELAARLRELG